MPRPIQTQFPGLPPAAADGVVTRRKFRLQTSGVGACPPAPDSTLVTDRLEAERTVFNADRTHRFTLYRREATGCGYECVPRADGRPRDPDRYCAFIGMNPSGADEVHNDRTVSRCYAFALQWGFDALYMLNAFSLRSTDSDGLYRVATPSLPENDAHIRRVVAGAGRVVVAWGKPGGDFNRGNQVEAILRACVPPERVLCFGRNKDGTPAHPLYQPASAELQPYFGR